MNIKPSFWIVLGIAIGSAAGVAFHNIPAGICLGAAIGILIMLLSFTTERNNRN